MLSSLLRAMLCTDVLPARRRYSPPIFAVVERTAISHAPQESPQRCERSQERMRSGRLQVTINDCLTSFEYLFKSIERFSCCPSARHQRPIATCR